MTNTPTTDPVQTAEQISAEYEARVASVPEAARRFADETWGETWAHAEMGSLLDFAGLCLSGPLAQLQADLIAVRKERDAFEQEVKGLRERLEELQGATATPSGSQASPEAPSDLRPEGFDPSRTPAPHMEGLWPRRPNPTRHPDGSAMFYDIPWIKDWRTVTGRTLKEGMEAHRRALHGLMAYGCCSAVSPCSHQRRDPYSLCLTCQGIADQAEASATEARRVETLGSTCEGAAPTGETPNPNPLTQEEADA